MTAKLWYDDPEHNFYIWEFDNEQEAREFYDNQEGDRSFGNRPWKTDGFMWEITLGHDPDDQYDWEAEERRSIMNLAMGNNPDLAFTADDMEGWF